MYVQSTQDHQSQSSFFKWNFGEFFHGLHIAIPRGFSRVIVESDSQLAINLLTKGCYDPRPCAQLVKVIKDMTNRCS